MSLFAEKLKTAQNFLKEQGIDGWLLYDFKRLNPLACHFLEIPKDFMLTRRFYTWIPQEGEPISLVSAIENPLAHVPGQKIIFKTWQELESELAKLLAGSKKIAMEYSPKGRVPEVSKVDGGTLELIRSFGVEVVSSGDLFQQVSCVLSEAQAFSQRKAAIVAEEAILAAWEFIKNKIDHVTEREVQAFLLDEIAKGGCLMDGLPIVGVGAHSADPHWSSDDTMIRQGDFILIDLWCKQKGEGSIYADICRVGVAREHPTDEEEKVFNLVFAAQNAAIDLVRQRFKNHQPVFGWEVDQAARVVIERGGYGDYFVHRTGHNIFESDHGPGCHNDNLETEELRQLLKGTCCSIEPGIYLPGKFGVRLESDLLISLEGEVEITGGIQRKITSVF